MGDDASTSDGIIPMLSESPQPPNSATDVVSHISAP
jgi:hypothetical protein